MAPNVVEIILALQNLRPFVAGTKQATTAVEGVGKATEKTGKQTQRSWKSLAKWGAGAGALYGATKFLRGAVSTTTDLAKSTLMLNRTTGMGVRGASAWAAVAKVRGLQIKQLNMGFVKLSRAQQQAEGGSKTAAKSFAQLGIPLKQLRTMNTDTLVMRISDAFKTMHNPARRAALTQQLFGRSGQQLLPILASGSKGIKEQLGMAAKYGLTLKGKTLGQVKEMIAQQREMKLAWEGVKVQMGTALLPILIAVGKVLLSLARAIAPLTKNATAMKVALIVLTAAFVAYKTAVLIARIETLLMNSVWLASPITWIVLGLAAIAIGFIVLYKKCKWFRDIVQATWKWIKSHWPLLITVVFGPMGLAIALLVTHFRTVKRVAVEVFGWVKRAVRPVIDAIRTLVGLVKQAVQWLGKVHIPGSGVLKKGAGLLGKVNPFQHGGSVTSRTLGLVGERGPELVSLPGGATVAPMTRSATLAAAGGGGGQPIVVQVMLDRRVLAEAVARDTADRVARR